MCKHKQSAVTKNGKSYDNLILQDKTGVMDAKIWDPNSAGIAEFDGVKLNVVSDGDYIGAQEHVRVQRVDGNRIVVRRCDGEGNLL